MWMDLEHIIAVADKHIHARRLTTVFVAHTAVMRHGYVGALWSAKIHLSRGAAVQEVRHD